MSAPILTKQTCLEQYQRDYSIPAPEQAVTEYIDVQEALRIIQAFLQGYTDDEARICVDMVTVFGRIYGLPRITVKPIEQAGK